MDAQKRVRELKKEGVSNQDIQVILYNESNKVYSIDTIRVYSRARMDLDKDNKYMEHCKEEYKEKEIEEDSLLDTMFSLAKSRGIFN